MGEQSFIQVRIDNSLKQEATSILNDMGMDMPNAIRMFLKRIVIERGLPFDAKLPSMTDEVNSNDDTSPKQSYTYYPAHPVKYIPMKEYIDLLCQVPAGKITRIEDIEHYLEKKHGVSHVQIDYGVNFDNPLWEGIPIWREVSSRGMLQNTLHCSREEQESKLRQEGHNIVPCGANQRSLKVENYRDFLFDFTSL